MKKQKFTLVELLIVIGIIGLLVAVVSGAYPSIIEKAKRKKTETGLMGVELAMKQFQQSYNRPPKEFDDMKSDSNKNPRKLIFFDDDKAPEDPFNLGEPLKIVKNVHKVEKDDQGRIIAAEIKDNARGMIIYSVGVNGEKDGEGKVSGGLYGPGADGEFGTEDDLDDISVFVQF